MDRYVYRYMYVDVMYYGDFNNVSMKNFKTFWGTGLFVTSLHERQLVPSLDMLKKTPNL